MDVRRAAQSLEQARLHRRTVAPLSGLEQATLEDAYRVQDAVVATRLQAGESLAGAKLGLTSRGAQQAAGISEPVYGLLTTGMNLAGAPLQRGSLIAPRAELEVVLVVESIEPRADLSAEDVRAATRSWTIGIEIFDSRYSGPAHTADIVADNVHAACFALCEETFGREVSPVGLECSLYDGRGNRQVGEIQRAPWDDVALLLRFLAGRGKKLPSGAIILAGGITVPVEVDAGRRLHGELDAMAAIDVVVEE